MLATAAANTIGATPPQPPDDPRIAELKRRMIAAHPDKGGSVEALITARSVRRRQASVRPGPAVFAITCAADGADIQENGGAHALVARLAFSSLLSERVELFADPSEVSVEEKLVRPFSRPKDAPGA
jgi:hypothetical protein